ncbi:hypothetical protein FGE12_29080 [Aggregicoccus sp. 17bor-14]|nr:hypothetical protein [Simulacricoccus sp. 17bor-14]MRI92220.1 hypothetical protein [Aggregicoccus sp. 17bor-14]
MEEDTPEPERHRHLLRDVLLPGALVGMVGAVLMALVCIGLSLIAGAGPARPAELAAGLFFRDAVPSGALAVVLGLLVHGAVAGGVGTLFALLCPRGGTAVAALALGMLLALSLQALMPTLVLYWAAPPLARSVPSLALAPGHLAFGAALGLLPAARRLTGGLDRGRRRVLQLAHAALE